MFYFVHQILEKYNKTKENYSKTHDTDDTDAMISLLWWVVLLIIIGLVLWIMALVFLVQCWNTFPPILSILILVFLLIPTPISGILVIFMIVFKLSGQCKEKKIQLNKNGNGGKKSKKSKKSKKKLNFK